MRDSESQKAAQLIAHADLASVTHQLAMRAEQSATILAKSTNQGSIKSLGQAGLIDSGGFGDVSSHGLAKVSSQ